MATSHTNDNVLNCLIIGLTASCFVLLSVPLARPRVPGFGKSGRLSASGALLHTCADNRGAVGDPAPRLSLGRAALGAQFTPLSS